MRRHWCRQAHRSMVRLWPTGVRGSVSLFRDQRGYWTVALPLPSVGRKRRRKSYRSKKREVVLAHLRAFEQARGGTDLRSLKSYPTSSGTTVLPNRGPQRACCRCTRLRRVGARRGDRTQPCSPGRTASSWPPETGRSHHARAPVPARSAKGAPRRAVNDASPYGSALREVAGLEVGSVGAHL